MKKLVFALLSLTFFLYACSTSRPPTDAASLTPGIYPDSPTPSIPKIARTLQTPHIDQPPNGNESTVAPGYGDCGYQWAYQDLPELSTKFLQAVQQLQPSAQANALAFGEDCVHANGKADFLAMETDFNITLQVSGLPDANQCGEWIVKIMQVILEIPKEEIMGPRPGRVSLGFQAGSDQKNFSFYIDRYQALPAGLGSAEICQTLQTPQS